MDATSRAAVGGEHPDSVAAPATPSPLGVALKTRRTELALSQRALARAANVAQSTIAQLETGAQSETTPANIHALATALGCEARDLVGWAVLREPAPSLPDGGSAGLRLIPHALIDRSPLNPRRHFSPAALDDLAASLRERGVLQNLLVRPDPAAAGRYLIVAGERRWRAAGLNIERDHWPTDHPLPCKVVEADEAEHRTLAIIENLQREEVSPLDEAESMRSLLTYEGWDTDRLARAIGKTARHVQLRLALLTRLDEDVRAALANGAIVLAVARALTAAPLVLQRDMLDRILRGDPSLRRAEDVAAQVRAAVWPARRSLFARADYTGPATEDAVTGEELLLDVEQCRTLQQAAIAAKVAELQTRFDWVLLKEHNDFWTPGGADRIAQLTELSPAEDVEDGYGAVVRVAGNLDVVVFEDLAKRAAPPAPPAAAADDDPAQDARRAALAEGLDRLFAPTDPVEAVSQDRRRYALQAKTRALQAAILAHPGAWKQQLVLALLGCRDLCDVAAPPPRPENAVVDAEISDVLQRFRDDLGADLFLPISADWPYLSLTTEGPATFYGSVTEAALALLPRLQALPDDEMDLLLAALTASRCSTRFLPARPNLGDGPLVLATAAAVGADVVTHGWRLNAAYLATLTADQMERLAEDIGAAPDLEEFAALTRKQQERCLLDAVAANDVRHVPPELRFAPRAEIETALRADSEEPSTPTAPAPCAITGLPDAVDADALARLRAAIATLPEYGRIALPLEANGATLTLFKAAQHDDGTPLIYDAEAFDDGFARRSIGDVKPSHLRSFVSLWLEQHALAAETVHG